jgi:hypothetical protein
MGLRSHSAWFVALSSALVCSLISFCFVPAAVAVDGPAPGAWARPVAGAVSRPFVQPRSHYGAGHRGVDFVAPAGTPVRAANSGVVAFAGNVAGTLHVVVSHAGGLRTSSSFLATIAVHRGDRVTRGAVLGTAGGGVGEHAGVLHFGLRVGERYVDPMALFAPTDLSRLIRLAPVRQPAQQGFDPPAVESRSLAESLHLPKDMHAIVAPEADGGLFDGISSAFGDLTDTVDGAIHSRGAQLVGEGAMWLWRRSALAQPVADVRTMGERLLAYARSRETCTDDTRQPSSGGGSGHLVMTVAGINSSQGANGGGLAVDAAALGYRSGEVTSFTYSRDGMAYTKEDTYSELRGEAKSLGNQLRALQRRNPGREVDLVAHSQGGVVVAEFLAHVYDTGDPTLPPLGSVVTLSSPLQGAPAATSGARIRESATGRFLMDEADAAGGGMLPPSSGKSTAQLAETSRFMTRLRSSKLPDQIDLTSIGATDDFIVPADQTTRADAQNITVNPAGPSDHTAVYRDPAAMDAARLALEQRPLPCVGIVAGVRGAIEPVVINRVEHQIGDSIGRRADAVDVLLGQGDLP